MSERCSYVSNSKVFLKNNNFFDLNNRQCKKIMDSKDDNELNVLHLNDETHFPVFQEEAMILSIEVEYCANNSYFS